MLVITTALYCEAQPFIQYYNLRKDPKLNKFQVFKNDDIILLITNPGSLSAAVGLTWLCTLLPPGSSDLLLNIGVCAAADKSIPAGSIFICNKITEQMTNRCYYPDILFSHPFREGGIVTFPVPVRLPEICPEVLQGMKKDCAREGNCTNILADMEAAGVYQAASCFFKTHQLVFLKIVSDYGDSEGLTPEVIIQLVRNKLPELTCWIGEFKNISKTENEKLRFTPEEEVMLGKLSQALFCTVTMGVKLRQMLIFYKLTHGSITEPITEVLGQLEVRPCNTKLEGKKYFEQLREQLL